MKRPVVPIANIRRRLPEAGRLRFGVRTGKAMKAIDTWRVTSHDEESIRQVAAIYGGKVEAWTDAPTPGQWQVTTEASELQVVLPPEPLSAYYELWSGGGCQRRCDGVRCEVVGAGPDGAELQDVDCICSAQETMECEPHLRLSVILEEIRFGGVWRMETKSWNALAEIPGMVAMIEQVQQRGLSRAVLSLEHRKSVTAGQTRRFVLPVLGLADSMTVLAAGAVGPPAPPDSRALPAGQEADDTHFSFVGEEGAVTAVQETVVIDDAEVDYVSAWADAGLRPSQALRRAREVAEAHGLPLPAAIDEIDDGLARLLLASLEAP